MPYGCLDIKCCMVPQFLVPREIYEVPIMSVADPLAKGKAGDKAGWHVGTAGVSRDALFD